MPSRTRLYATRLLAAALCVAAIALLVVARPEASGEGLGVQRAGLALPSLVAAALLAGSAALATPTVLFSIRRRRFRRILRAEG